jgi:hypothetical protein
MLSDETQSNALQRGLWFVFRPGKTGDLSTCEEVIWNIGIFIDCFY